MFGATTIVAIACLLTADCFFLKDPKETSLIREMFNMSTTRRIRDLKGEKGNGTAGNPLACKPAQVCYHNSECPGGRCVGVAVGKCNCGACTMFAQCSSDEQCGGLPGACNEFKYCDCDKGFKTIGMEAGTLDAIVKLCNVRECVPNSSACYGLPCNSGVCACPI